MTGARVAAAVAEYVFGAQHAFVVQTLYDSAVPSFTAHAAAASMRSSSVDLIHFILVDLVSVGLLAQSSALFSLVALGNVHKAVKAVPDSHPLGGFNGAQN